MATNRFLLRVPGGDAQEFTDAREAGAAFFHADGAERPAVIHELATGGARFMAETELHGTDANGKQVFVKTLPDSHDVDADFRAGYLEAQTSYQEAQTLKQDRAESTNPVLDLPKHNRTFVDHARKAARIFGEGFVVFVSNVAVLGTHDKSSAQSEARAWSEKNGRENVRIRRIKV
ncbi:hypothetical protein [Azovibrio restrictus]|uniref:hypothetical protein n=1 Tax=Azovibrio restrictus TaxID=146938 RepID=UPI0026ECA1DC|nr:hypothetical protein [Azovibrio restrictus]MDD3482995.1 hypothetical protein [Azovibrio restrictus]